MLQVNKVKQNLEHNLTAILIRRILNSVASEVRSNMVMLPHSQGESSSTVFNIVRFLKSLGRDPKKECIAVLQPCPSTKGIKHFNINIILNIILCSINITLKCVRGQKSSIMWFFTQTAIVKLLSFIEFCTGNYNRLFSLQRL